MAIPKILVPISRHAVMAQDMLDEMEVHELAELPRISRRRGISLTCRIFPMNPAIRG